MSGVGKRLADEDGVEQVRERLGGYGARGGRLDRCAMFPVRKPYDILRLRVKVGCKQLVSPDILRRRPIVLPSSAVAIAIRSGAEHRLLYA
jgi:hypothetical protein